MLRRLLERLVSKDDGGGVAIAEAPPLATPGTAEDAGEAEPRGAEAGAAPAASGGAEASAPPLTVKALRRIVTDASELVKGTQLADGGKLVRLARFQRRLFAEAAGSGARPYRVSIDFGPAGGDATVKGRCSCMAARSRPFCKHAAALLVLWARSPGAFVQADEAPAEVSAAGSGTRQVKKVKKGRKKAEELMRDGLDQVETLVHELAGAGVANLTRERIAQIRTLGTGLREYRLRRLSARCLALADLLEQSDHELDEVAYAGHLGDLLLTASKVRKHALGEALDPRYVEELIGKTWHKADRQEVTGLELVEYAFRSHTTPDDFEIRESRFVDLTSGEHYAEKQILPRAMARRAAPKPSYAGNVLPELSAQTYPGFPPRRLHLEGAPRERALGSDDLERIVARASSVAAALAAFLEHRRDVFAPPALPVAVAATAIAAVDGRLLAVDSAGQGCHVDATPQLERDISEELRGAELRTLLGDVVVEGVLPKLRLHAAVVERAGALALAPLAGPSELPVAAQAARSWIEVAKEAGLSKAALSLGEVRQELAQALSTGLGAFGPRTADPLLARLRDLRLDKLADLLAEVVATEENEARVRSFVKAQQLLEIALLRLASTTAVDLDRLCAVPSIPSLLIREPERVLAPAEVSAARAAGRLSSYEAAWHYGRFYESIGPERLADDLAIWADGSARPYLLGALAERAELGMTGARRVLVTDCGRTAAWTALALLRRIGGERAEAVLRDVLREGEDKERRPAIHATLGALQEGRARGQTAAYAKQAGALDQLLNELAGGGDLEVRRRAATRLGHLGSTGAIPALRRAFFDDPAARVRREAAYALASLGDVEMTDLLLGRLEHPGDDGKTALVALGILGDRRALPAVLAAYLDGGRPQNAIEALQGFGVLAIGPLLDLVAEQPELGKREALRSVLAAQPGTQVREQALDRLAAWHQEEGFPARAKGLLQVLARSAAEHQAVAARILELTTEDQGKGVKPLRNLAAKAVSS